MLKFSDANDGDIVEHTRLEGSVHFKRWRRWGVWRSSPSKECLWYILHEIMIQEEQSFQLVLVKAWYLCLPYTAVEDIASIACLLFNLISHYLYIYFIFLYIEF